jgi:vacuolar-type H+-ATPase subunit C/Vma6
MSRDVTPIREPADRSVRRVETYEEFVRRVAHENADTILEHVTNLEAEVERVKNIARNWADKADAEQTVRRKAVAEVELLREALRPFAALADAMDAFDGMTDDEWCRIKARVSRQAAAARTALNA